MKLFCFGLLIPTTIMVSAQQNVGIGTAAPNARLHVVAVTNPTTIFDGPAGMYIQLNESGTYRGYLGSYAGDNDVDFGTGAGNATGKLHLTIQAGPKLTIRENGFVGINTTSPQYQMDVMGRVRLQAGNMNNIMTSAGIWHTDYRNNSDIVFAGMADSVNYGLWSQRPGIGWQFYFDARYGNVGIGVRPLSGSQRLSLSHPDGASLGLYVGNSYRGGLQATDSTLELRGYYASNVCFPIPCSPAKNIIIWPECEGLGCLIVPSSGRTGFYTNKPNARMHIVAGTGTSGVLISSSKNTMPAAGYMLNVGGKIICEELRVQVNTSWPDYVFQKNYKMPSLEELEESVMKTGHLPGIVSAAEVSEKGGVEVGELQRKLLEKIEELYRYVFELNKENKQLKAALAEKIN
jgi:hypothetical protein